eukprot:scaffold1091_cov125-Isochrysis_galbana.AAC.7
MAHAPAKHDALHAAAAFLVCFARARVDGDRGGVGDTAGVRVARCVGVARRPQISTQRLLTNQQRLAERVHRSRAEAALALAPRDGWGGRPVYFGDWQSVGRVAAAVARALAPSSGHAAHHQRAHARHV